MLEKSDFNKDGDVTRQEFKDYRSSEFPRLNTNQDNFISSADLPPVVEERVIVDISKEMIEDFDTDGDGKVSRREFDAGPTLAFNRIDGDGNGIASRYEIVAARSAASSC
jgi:Ca2+-binding EF-hand superfamily protein